MVIPRRKKYRPWNPEAYARQGLRIRIGNMGRLAKGRPSRSALPPRPCQLPAYLIPGPHP